MAGPIQVGDIIKFTELAWTVWNYGWASEYDAGCRKACWLKELAALPASSPDKAGDVGPLGIPTARATLTTSDHVDGLKGDNYRAFGADVRALHGSLKALEDAVTQAQASLLNHGAQNRDILGGDKASLSEIIGDYESTLDECYKLLEKNRRYAQIRSPVRNIDWNLNIMPQVDYLRDRIQMHNTRIQHVLKPFEIDLINKFHGDLVQRITGLHTDVLCIKRNISTLIAESYPEVAKAIMQQAEQELYSVRIPDSLVGRLQGMLERCYSDGSSRSLTLQEMTDCFLVHFGKTTVQLQPAIDGHKTCPPTAQYIELLKCQLLMHRIKSLKELHNPPKMSHWPGYVGALEEKLSQQCARFQTELIAPDTSDCTDESLAFWPEDEPKPQIRQQIIGPSFSWLLEVPLATESDEVTWRMMQLLRATGSDHRFRIIETWGHNNQPPIEETKVVDFNITTATVIPIYADPVDGKGSPPPLEIILEENDVSYQYVFLDIKDVLLFQQAITGFKVADNYMEPRAVAVFVRPGQERSVKEDVTIQLWLPSHIKEQPEAAGDPPRRHSSTASQEMPPFHASHSRRTSSIFSHQSVAAMSFMSYSSSGSEGIVSVRLDGSHASASHAVIRPRLRNPLLVLFTKCGETSKRSIVAITIDDETKPNPERCNCQNFRDCRITALEQRHGPSLRARRLENRANWNLLPLASAPSWSGLLRVSILFPTAEARFKFGGGCCRCRPEIESEVDACVSKQHQGLLGIVRVYYRRQMVLWQEQRDDQREVDAR